MNQYHPPYIVSLDFGTSSGKCLIFDSRGTKVYQVNMPWRGKITNVDDGFQTSFDEKKAWKVIAGCCKKALVDSRIDLKDIACVVPTSQRHGAVLLDEKGNGIIAFTNGDERNASPWQDIVGENSELIYQITGRWPQTVFLPAHLLWLRKFQPQKYQAIDQILGIQDWLVFQLSGELCSEATIATDLLLFDIRTGTWSKSITELFDVSSSWLPSIIPAGTKIGMLTTAAANATGLLPGTPVLNGAADSQLASLGLGALDEHDLVAAFGTSIPLQLVMHSPILHPDAITWTNRHIFENQWVLESNSGDSGLCLYHFHGSFLPTFQKSICPESDIEVPSLMELDTLASKLDRNGTRLIASVGPIIFNGREWVKVEGILKGVNLIGNAKLEIPQLYLALLRNIGYAIHGNVLQLENCIEHKSRRIFIGGPALESPLWPQFIADILDRPIFVPQEKEVTPLGSAVLAAWKLGIHSSLEDATRNMVNLGEVRPDSDTASFHRRHFQEWMEVYQISLRSNNAS